MNRAPRPVFLLALGLVGGAAVWWWYRQQSTAGGASGSVDSTVFSAMQQVGNALGFWSPPDAYAGMIDAATARYSLPDGLLARVLWQESRYRDDIITGKTRSPAGALGIAQFMPATAAEFGINPLDPAQAIDAAGKYLQRLYNRFGNWSEALAAYNWGQGNVSRKGLARAPLETVNYFTSILSDLGLT